MIDYVSYIRNPDKDKLDLKARKCIYISYGANDMGYCFWNDQNKKVIRSKDVIFNENAVYKDRHEINAKGERKPTEKEKAMSKDSIKDDLAGKSENSEDSYGKHFSG